jgi:DNA-binding NtrC family response regulator
MHRILVIDDDRSVGAAIKMMLEHDGYEVLLAHDGRTGIASIEPGRFNVVIVDIFMPGMDGLETIRHIQYHAPLVPIIAISGFMFRGPSDSTPNFLSMAAKLGAARSLQKPFRPRDLLDAVEGCLADTIRIPEGKPEKVGVAGSPRK